MKNKEKLLEEAPYSLIREFRSEKIDTEKVYDFNVKDCCREIKNVPKEPSKPPINIYFDCETYTTKRFKHVPYLVCLKDESGTTSFKSEHVFEEMLDHLAQKYGVEKFGNDIPTLKMFVHNSTDD